jgi:hypothetical protein
VWTSVANRDVKHHIVFDAEPTVAVTHSVVRAIRRACTTRSSGPARYVEFLAATGGVTTTFGSGYRLAGVATSDAASNHLPSAPNCRRSLTSRA